MKINKKQFDSFETRKIGLLTTIRKDNVARTIRIKKHPLSGLLFAL